MTQETPAKVLSLLGVSLASMFFLFAVAFTNASFERQQIAFPDPFNSDKVMAELDSAANSYSRFVSVNLIQPGEQSYAILQDTVAYVIDNADYQILAYTGLTPLVEPEQQPKVAGAYIQAAPQLQISGKSHMSVFDFLFGPKKQ